MARVTTDVVGPWLGAWTVLAAGISNIGLFQAELSADALQLMGMADKGYVPKVFAQRSKHGTPTYGIGLGVAIIIVLGISNLDELIEMLNFNYSLSLLLEYAAFLYLRIYRPDLHRPYRIPLSTAGCFVLMTPTILLTVFMIALASYKTLFFAGVVSLIGVGLYQYKHVYERVSAADDSGHDDQ
uniref:Amino acid permease/ SLC12A domain-containing protein n=1 Tax=Craspedostauros australis TaxID=1486917 RepID=A0A7R9WNA8_9STRA